MSNGTDQFGRFRRFFDRPVIWAIVVVVAAIFVVVGLNRLDGRLIQTEARAAWADRIVIAAGLGIVVAEAARRIRWWLGAGLLLGLLAFTVLAIDSVAVEVRLEQFSESDRRPTAASVPIDADPSAAPPPAGVRDRDAWDSLELTLEPVLTGLVQPMAVEPIAGTDDYFVLQREGEIRRVSEGSSGGAVMVDLSDETSLDGERGFFDLAVGPVDGRLYVSFSDLEGDNRVISYAIEDDGLTDRNEVIEITQPFRTHNGGSLDFDAEGCLLLGVGDGGRLRDPLDAGQDRSNRLATIVRIVPLAGGGYEIPPDNPYLDQADVWPEIYAFGLRNPWRISVDSLTGDIWIGDVGQDGFEEVDQIPFGADGRNFGWSRTEGAEVHTGSETGPTGYTEADVPSDHEPPVFFYAHDPDGVEGARNSITGGYIYRGEAIDILDGSYVYGDFSASVLAMVLIDDGVAVANRDLLHDLPAVVGLGLDHDAELLVISLAGEISRLVAQ